MQAYDLQINHLSHPVGIAGKNLKLTWKLRGGIRQTAYEVRRSNSRGHVIENSGKIKGSVMAYDLRKSIPPRSKQHILLTVWDEDDIPSESTLDFETGIARREWKASWIDPEPVHEKVKLKKGEKAPRYRASYLRRVFTLTADQVSAAKRNGARLYATCHGIMNFTINGSEITDRQLMPGSEQYDKRLMVETLPVEQFLVPGENEIIATLGDGWYRGSMGYDQNVNVYGTDIALLAQLEVAGKVVCVTDAEWKASQNGPLGLNDFMNGEEYDASKVISDWHEVHEKDYGTANLICTDTVPILPKETFSARWVEVPNGEKVLDFGQNLVGYTVLDFVGQAGKKLLLEHCETLDENGNFSDKHFQNPGCPMEQDVRYICRDGRNQYHPTKTYMGFRYVRVTADFEFKPEDIRAVAIYSDMAVTAKFTCGVPEVDQLFRNALWSMKGNFIDVPTDCPTREKSGYSGDCEAYIYTAMYLMDCYPVYAKWLREQAAGQYKDGCVPQIAPKCNKPGKKQKMGGIISADGGIGWSDSFEIVPMKLYERYGDDSIIRAEYPALKRWTEFEIRRARKTNPLNFKTLPFRYRRDMIDTGWMWGEWLEPGQDAVNYMKNLILHGDAEVGTAFYYLHLDYMAKMAEQLGEKKDAERYRRLAEKAKTAYRAVFTDNGVIREEKRQCRYVRPIEHDLLSEKEKKAAAEKLAEMIHANGDHLNTGFLTTHALNRTLTRYGQNSTAVDLLLQKDRPGWLYAVTKGATTIPESWDCWDDQGVPHDSHNHYSYGAVVGWLIDSICGIRCENGKITVEPHPDRRLGHAEAVYESPAGRIVSGWEYSANTVRYHVEIPANSIASVIIDGQVHELEAGDYEF